MIEKKGSNNFVKLEYFIISHLLNINDDFDYVRNNQRLLNYKNKTIDYIKMKITNKRKSTERFKEFYREVSHKKFTTAMLQEFFFYNRECENILELLDEFIKIVDKNDPKNFEVVKEENKNFYS